MIDDIKKIQLRLGKDVKDLTRMLDAHLATIPEEGQEVVKESRADMQQLLKSIKDGDQDTPNKILKKYANIRR